MTTPMLAGLGTPELLLILAVVVLLFGASKLPDLARGSGRALRIFKAETKGLLDDDDDAATTAITPPAVTTTSSTTVPDSAKTQAQLELEARRADLARRQAELNAEAERLRGETSS
jgi:sec-independent protein translocase protein TatA